MQLASRKPEQLKEIETSLDNGWLKISISSGNNVSFTVTNIMGLKSAITAGLLTGGGENDKKIASLVAGLFIGQAKKQNSYAVQNQKIMEETMKDLAAFYARIDAEAYQRLGDIEIHNALG